MSSRLQDLAKAAAIVQSDPDIMGKRLCFAERELVYLVVDMIEQGTSIEEILEGYLRLLARW